VSIGESTPPSRTNLKDMDTKFSFSKELIVPKASLGGTKKLREIDSPNSNKELLTYMGLDIIPPNL
jgi:hypothetical protein